MILCCVFLSCASARVTQNELAAERRQAEKTFNFEIQVPPAEVLPLFGPVRESEWDPAWKPRFLYPAAGSNTRAGAVFTVTHEDGRETVWILLEYSAERMTIHYAVVSPEVTAAEIWVRVSPTQRAGARVDVTQRRTSLRPEADELISKFERHFQYEASHWQGAIEAYLRRRTTK